MAGGINHPRPGVLTAASLEEGKLEHGRPGNQIAAAEQAVEFSTVCLTVAEARAMAQTG